ncbi:MAG: phage holin family protein [Sandaracinus sp.]|nr:phage holin family protein [Myxococcales bacterium]MCB9613040.1 phage holin family protein [Sandaracinus sp.]
MELFAALTASFLVSALTLGIAARFTKGLKVDGALGYVTVPLVFALLETFLGGLLTVAITFVIGLLTVGLGFFLGFVVRIFVRAWLIEKAGAITGRLEVESYRVALKVSLLIGVLAFAAEHLARLVF